MALTKIQISKVCDKVEFDPSPLTAAPGDQIFWLNNDKVTHTVAVKNPDGSNVAIVDPIGPGQSSDTFSPSSKGTIAYFCIDGDSNTGTINVI
jgi:plastocyanin